MIGAEFVVVEPVTGDKVSCTTRKGAGQSHRR
jgi:hypothetical protein